MQKELVITLAEAEQELVEAVNGILQKHGLPCYLFEPILDKVHRQVAEAKANELLAARARAQAGEEAEK